VSELTMEAFERDLKKIIVQDYKVTSAWSLLKSKDNPNGYKEEWVKQQNVYAWLCRANGYRVTKLQIIAILRDWQKSKAFESQKNDGGYPLLPIQIVDLPLWSDKEQQDYIKDRIETHQQADFLFNMENKEIDCTNKERWKGEDVYAVMVDKQKRAKKLFTNLKEAEEFKITVPKAFVEIRKGISRRCAQYCSVVNYCKQARKEGYGKQIT
tara:strand:+ start:3366 stop:3998 length:633 start_codon:yes stop_codon:yes gene_type:complete